MTLKHGRLFAAVVTATAILGIQDVPSLTAQSAPLPASLQRAAFEVASVKVRPLGSFSISPYGRGSISIRSVSLSLLISMAYGVSGTEISGGPGWHRTEYYDVDAKAEDGVMLTYDELRPRLQELLTQRFKLAIHREVKPTSGYALVIAKSGARLKSNNTPTASAAILPGGLRASSVSMDSFAAMVARAVRRPVRNETGLDGHYEITLDYAQDAVADSSLPSIFTALEERLGLKLDSRTIPVEVIVIDHAEHPTEN